MAYLGQDIADVAVAVGQGVIDATHIKDASITTADIGNDAITANKIDDDGTGFQMGSLGLGGAVTGSDKLTVTGDGRFTGTVRIPHDTTDALRIGASDDLELWHNGTDSAVTNANTGKLYLWNYATGNTILGSNNTESLVADGANITFRGTGNFADTVTIGTQQGNKELMTNRARMRHLDGVADANASFSHGDLYLNHISTGTIYMQRNSNFAGNIELTGTSGQHLKFADDSGSSWSGNHAKIQHHNSYMYLQGGSSGIILRTNSGTNAFTMNSSGDAEFSKTVLISGSSDSPLSLRNTSGGEMFLKFLNPNGTINGAIISNSNSDVMMFRAGNNTFLTIDGTGQPEFNTTTSNDTTFTFKKTTNGGGNASVNIVGRREAVNSDCSAINFKNTYSGSDRLIGNIIANTVDSNGLSGKLRLRTSNGGTVSDALVLNHDTSAEFTGNVTLDGATNPIFKIVGDSGGESSHIQLHRSNGEGFTIYDTTASLAFRADLSGSNPQILQLKSDQSSTFYGEKICLNPADNNHLVRTGFHGKTLTDTYTDVFGFITQNDHEGIYYEIIITGGDWGSHSAHRGRFTGFINGHDGYNGHYPIHNHQAWGSTQLNVTWSGSTNNRTAKLQMKITRASGSADSPAKIYYKFVGRQITFYKY